MYTTPLSPQKENCDPAPTLPGWDASSMLVPTACWKVAWTIPTINLIYIWQETGSKDSESAFPEGDSEGLNLECLMQNSNQSIRSTCLTQALNNQLHDYIQVQQNCQEMHNVPVSWDKRTITVSTVSDAYQRSVLFCASIMLSNRGALILSCFSRTVMTSSSCASHSGWLMSRTWTTKSYTDKERVPFDFSVGNFGLP